jgi:FkbM family methyltransferase
MKNIYKEILESKSQEFINDNNIIIEFFNANSSRKKYLFGINECSLQLSSVFITDGFIDDFTTLTELNGIKIFRTDDIEADGIVINCTLSISPVSVEKKLKAKFLGYLNYFQLANSFPLLTPLNVKIKDQNIDFYINNIEYERLFESLDDLESKKVFVDLMKYRLSGNIKYMYDYSVRPQDQYFENFVKLPDNAVFVDGGGFDGDSTELFCKFCNDYGKVYLFEPDINNISQAKIRLKNHDRIEFIDKAISDKVGILKFLETNNMVSKVSEIGQNVIVTTIDVEIKEKIDFIKLDLEGFDLLALKGAKNHIVNDYPTLAIAVYHEISHIYDIFNYVMDLQPNYSVRIRHYTEGDSETIMYFLPK